MKKVFVLLALCLTVASAVFPCFAQAENIGVDVRSKEALLMSETGEVLFEYKATEKRPIASMTKIMTLLCVYDAVKKGEISLDDEVHVSQNAASMGGSQVFLDANTTHKLSNLVKSVIVCSANDSCVALAEHICGNVGAFVDRMNQKAKELRLVSTHFENCTGLPQADHYSCALDVANMMRKLIEEPHYFECSKVWLENYEHPDGRVTEMTNTNKLVHFYEGCDGGKTGYTAEAMHCLSATAKRGETRFIAVVVGAPDSKTRFAEVSSLFNYGFAHYESTVMLDKSKTAASVPVIGGKTNAVDALAKEKLIAFSKKGENTAELTVETLPLRAPVRQGDVVGKAVLTKDGKVIAETELLAAATVESKDFLDYLKDIAL